MLKKTMLLAAMALGAVAFAVPAMASATDVWTHYEEEEHQTLGAGKSASQSFEGFFKFNAGMFGTFGCEVTVEIRAEGPSSGKVTKFNPTTATCEGTGPAFTGCVLKEDFSNITTIDIIEEEEVVTNTWSINIASTPGTVSANSGNLTIRTAYESCVTGSPGSHLEFESLSMTPTLNGEGTITKLSISGFTIQGLFYSGSFSPEGNLTLGIESI